MSKEGEPNGEHYSRRSLLKTAGAGAVVVGGMSGLAYGLSEIMEDDDSNEYNHTTTTPEPLDVDVPNDKLREYELNHLSLRENEKTALEEVYSIKGDRGLESISPFLKDEAISNEFRDTQLSYWNELDKQWKIGVIKQDAWDWDDWSGNGRPHINPDGSPGPADPMRPVSSEGDAFADFFFNFKGKVYDVRSGEYLGFQPYRGDRVGKRGDKNGEGTITKYIDKSVEDITDHMNTVFWIDVMEDGPNGQEIYFSDGVIDELDRFWKEKPPDVNNSDGFEGIDFHHVGGKSVPYQEETGVGEAGDFYDESVPEELKGVTNYFLIADKFMPGDVGGKNFSPDHAGGGLITSYADTDVAGGKDMGVANTIMHEFGHSLGLLSHKGMDPGPEDNVDSLMSPGSAFDYLDKEWDKLIPKMNLMNRWTYIEDRWGLGER